MAEIKCPMCSKPNPAELDVCQFCEARLKPVTDELARSQPPIHPGDEPTDMATGDLEAVLPQWLRDVRQQSRDSSEEDAEQVPVEEEAAQPEEPANLLAGLQSQAEDDDEIPDWLAGLRGESKQPALEETTTEEDDLAALKSLLGEEAPAPQETETSELPGWISDLSADAERPQAEEDELSSLFRDSAVEEPTASDSDFEWGADFGTDTSPQADSVEEDAPIDTDLPAWLQGADEEEKGKAESDVPDWMGSEEPVPAMESEDTVGPTADESDMPDWLASLGEQSAEDTETDLGQEAAQSTTDWLASLGEEMADETPQQEDVQPAADGELPDWISSLGDESVEAAPQEEPAQPAAEGELPDWVSSLGEETAEAAPQEEPAQPSAEGELPDWVSSLGDETAEVASQEETLQSPAEGELPDWISSLGEETAEAAYQEETLQPTAESELPDWLTAPGEETAEVSAQQEVAQPAAEGETLDEMLSFGDEIAESELLAKDVQTLEPVSDEMAEEISAASAFVDDEGEPISTDDVDAIFSMDAPDWLSDGAIAGEPLVSPADGQEDDLSPADLPSWVQAMRPVESVISDTNGKPIEEQPMEDKGPLAGLRGVLPAVPGVGPSSKPKAYSLKLEASADQQSNAAMLEQMLAEEIHPKPITTQQAVLTQRLLRWIMAFLILLVVGGTIFTGTQINEIPAGAPRETSAALSYIQAMPPGAPVLLIFDYEAALTGELEAAAMPLVDHMVTHKNPRLSMISSTPIGTGLAERFIATIKILQTDRDYQRGNNFINLGYLPGGGAGVLAFSTNPAETKPLTTTGENAWETPVLQDVRQLSNFAAIILLTNDVETARIWIEQTETARGETGFLVISSAQSGPMILPYVQSGQVDGMVTGLDGSAPIEWVNDGRPGMVRRYWDAYGFGLLTAAVMISVGSLWSLISGWQARRKEQGDE